MIPMTAEEGGVHVEILSWTNRMRRRKKSVECWMETRMRIDGVIVVDLIGGWDWYVVCYGIIE
jgi:hypothetical protein